MKHLLVTFGYGNTAAIPVTDPAITGALVAALSQAVIVRREGYSADSKYIEEAGEVRVEFVRSELIAAGDETVVLRAKLEAAEKDLASTRGYWTQEQEKNKALQAKLAGQAA